jgi:hypothetical protein
MIFYSRNSKTISGRLHDEMVMMDPEQGKYFSLNQVATRIWDMLEGELTIDELWAMLREEYEVESHRCNEEGAGYLEEMARLGLIYKISR